jgi:hypothetical protein
LISKELALFFEKNYVFEGKRAEPHYYFPKKFLSYPKQEDGGFPADFFCKV